MANKDKLSYIIEERNRLIKHYKEKCEGLEEINALIKSILFLMLGKHGEVSIGKVELSSALTESRLKLRCDESNYYISVGAANVDDTAVCGDIHEEEQL